MSADSGRNAAAQARGGRALRSLLVLIAVALSAAGGWWARGHAPAAYAAHSNSPAAHAAHAHAPAPLPANTSLAAACRQNAFVDADKILGSVQNISRALPPSTLAGVRLDLDSILYVALLQAQAEAHCVAGGLRHGYEQVYAQTLRGAGALARERALAPEVAGIAENTAALIEKNRPLAAAR
jgi:hypothetical protein